MLGPRKQISKKVRRMLATRRSTHEAGTGRRRVAQVGSLSVSAGRVYGSGYGDADVEAFALEDGVAGAQDPALWGENAEDNVRVIEMINASHDAAAGLTGHAFRGEVLGVHRALEHIAVDASAAEQQALDDTDTDAEARRETEDLRLRMKLEGLQPPHEHASRMYILGLVALVLGDLTMIAVAFNVLGLSDSLVLGFLPFTSLDIAASTAVLSLLVLAHFAGKYAREVLHDVDRRRKTIDPEARKLLPPPSRIWLRIAVGLVVMAGGLLSGVSVVRSEYFAQAGTHSAAWPFALIQVGVFAAALALSLNHAHPYGREWSDTSRRMREAGERMLASCAVHAELVARCNGLIDEADALRAQAGKQVTVSLSDASRQGELYARRVQLSQPEPVSERLFPEQLPKRDDREDQELERHLIGIAPLPEFERLNTDRVTSRREECRSELAALRKTAISATAVGAASGWGSKGDPEPIAPGAVSPEAAPVSAVGPALAAEDPVRRAVAEAIGVHAAQPADLVGMSGGNGNADRGTGSANGGSHS
jgi:hypothetical protein